MNTTVCSEVNRFSYRVVTWGIVALSLFTLIPIFWIMKNGLERYVVGFAMVMGVICSILTWILWLNGVARKICVEKERILVKKVGFSDKVYLKKDILRHYYKDISEEEGRKAVMLNLYFKDNKILRISSSDFINYNELVSAVFS